MRLARRLKKEVGGGGLNTIRYTRYPSHTAYGFKGGIVLARTSGSSKGGDEEELEEHYITESSITSERLKHLDHSREVPHIHPEHAQTALDLMQQFHNYRQGLPSNIRATHKVDGSAAVHIINKNGKIGVTDKHRWDRNVVAWSPEEIDQHFGHVPNYAASLKHLMQHGNEIVSRNRHVKGDLMWVAGLGDAKNRFGKTKSTPNRITYEAKTNAPVGIAFHHEVVNGKDRSISPDAVRSSPNVFSPKIDYTPDPSTYSSKDRQAVEKHLSSASALLQDHSTQHLTPEHKKHFSIYVNDTIRRGSTPSVNNYIKYLQNVSQRETDKMKSEAGKIKKRNMYSSLINHVNMSRPHFQRTIDIENNLAKATDHLLNGVEHPDMKTSIDGKHSPGGEGIVISRDNKPLVKLVKKNVSQALLNNPKFGRGQK